MSLLLNKNTYIAIAALVLVALIFGFGFSISHTLSKSQKENAEYREVIQRLTETISNYEKIGSEQNARAIEARKSLAAMQRESSRQYLETLQTPQDAASRAWLLEQIKKLQPKGE